jgi:GMP synthase (glutamine-hydrolysing)
MARFYGGDARESPEPEFGAMQIELENGGGKIFANTAASQTVWESHNDEVHVVPEGFFITAGSPSCKVQGMENNQGNRFGLQFHPEVNDSEFGKEMFENFVEICRLAKDAKAAEQE